MNAFHKWVAYRAILARFFSRIEPDLARIGTQPMDAYGHRSFFPARGGGASE